MKKTSFALLLLVALGATGGTLRGQPQAGRDPLVSGVKAFHDEVKGYVLKSADQVPDALYGYRPTPEVRTFAQLFGHLADVNYQICAAAAGQKPPVQDIEKSKTTKAELTKVLGEALAYCDNVLAKTTDADAAKMIDFFGSPMAKLPALAYNAGHNYEHYGNIVTYMRLNKMVPPSSQPAK